MRTYTMIIKFSKETTIDEVKAFGFDVMNDSDCKGVFVSANKEWPKGIRKCIDGYHLALKMTDANVRKVICKKYNLNNDGQMRWFSFK